MSEENSLLKNLGISLAVIALIAYTGATLVAGLGGLNLLVGGFWTTALFIGAVLFPPLMIAAAPLAVYGAVEIWGIDLWVAIGVFLWWELLLLGLLIFGIGALTMEGILKFLRGNREDTG